MNILGVGAHYDDLELGCSGTLIKHIKKGDKVTMLVITDSSYRNPQGSLVRGLDIAQREGLMAAKIIGAKLINLKYKTFAVPFDDMLTKEINRYIEEFNIDTIYSHWIYDLHRDHQNTARCTLMAGRHVQRFLMYRSNFYDTDQQFHGSHYSDITDNINKKIKVIKAHKSELKRVRNRWLSFFIKQHENDGQKIGVKYAECFEVIRYLF